MAGDGGLCRRPRRYLRRQPPLRRYDGLSESRPQRPCGAPHGGANGSTLRDRRPSGVVRLLEESSPAETDAYIHRQLGTLLRQPEPRRQELLDTLASWLRCMGNQRRMARELHLHYNTVSYRLQQLWMLLEADPIDPMKRLALKAALYLYRYRRT